MNSAKRLHYILIGLVALLFIGLMGGGYAANKALSAEANKLVNLKAKDQAMVQQKASFTKAKQELTEQTALYKITRQIVPEDKSQAEAVRQIVKIADANSVSLSAITFPASTLGTGPAGTTKAPAAAPASGSKSLSQLTPVKNIPGVYLLPITVQGDSKRPVSYNNFLKFLNDLEHNRRTSQVDSITLTPSPQDPRFLTFTLIINEYIKP